MAKYSLNIYGKNDEIVNTYETNIVPWSVFIKAAELQESIAGKSVIEQMNAIGDILQCVFIGLTKEELYCADSSDIMNLFVQITNNGNKIKN